MTQLTKKTERVTLRVSEAESKDVGRGLARVDPAIMEQLGVTIGDIIIIEGKRQTPAKLMPTYPENRGKELIQIDGVLRENVKAGLDEKVKVSICSVEKAKKVLLRSVTGMTKAGEEGFFGRIFDGIPVLEGNKVRAVLFGSKARDFEVVKTNPSGVVIISQQTSVEIEGEEKAPASSGAVSYEDIGGLDKEIQRIREMIELPLRYPEVFDRLGIDAPKGVLLYGPPGTGKTLIARAVAHESEANFYTINGPEIVHKFYGESLPGDELVLTLKNGSFERKPIAEIVAEKEPELQVQCFGSDGKIRFEKVSGFFEHRFRGRLLRVRTASGRSIRVTDAHSLFTIDKNGITSIPTSELKIDHSFVAVPKFLPTNPRPIQKIDLLAMLKDDDDVVLRGEHVEETIRQSINILGREQCGQLLGFSADYVSDYLVNKHGGVRSPSLFRLAKAAGISVEAEKITLSTIRNTKGVPAILELNEDICSFFGWWLAEGSYSNVGSVRISLNSLEIDYVASICRRLFGKIAIYHKVDSESSADIYINSTPLVKIMQALGFTSGAHNKCIPNFVYNLSKNNIAALLRGYFSGDGSVNTVTPAPQIEVSTASYNLADGICHLLLYFGIVAKIYDRVSEQSKRICFADSENLKCFLEIGFVDSDRNAIIKRYLAKEPVSRRDKIPLDIIREQLGWRGDAWNGLASIGVEAVKKNVKSSLAAGLAIAVAGDIFWDKVVAIEKLPDKPEYVYDIAVDGCENFIAGFGGVFAHNSEAHLRSVFEKASQTAPSIIFLDEIDAIAPKRAEVQGDVEKRIVATLLSQMDGLKNRGQIVVIGATNIPDVLDPALRRPGRFDREIRIGIPDRKGREKILQVHTRGMPLTDDVDLKHLAEITHGYVGADLEALGREAAMICLRSVFSKPGVSLDSIPLDSLLSLNVTMDHFREALKEIEPSAIREIFVEVPNVKWSDVGGLEEVKSLLRETVEWPMKYEKIFQHARAKAPKGILLYGAPGTGKTLLAKALANESGVNFISVKGPELISKWVGESEKGIREVFKKAKAASPCIIFFDELDSIAPMRGGPGGDSGVTQRVISQLLTELDGIEELKGVIVLAATNRKDLIDPALLRSGRFDFLMSIPRPDEGSRTKIFEVHMAGRPLADGIYAKNLASETDGFSGSDIEAVCREATMLAIRKFIAEHGDNSEAKIAKLKITAKEFKEALADTKEQRKI